MILKLELEQLMAFVPGPDYPTEAEIITPSADIAKFMNRAVGH